MLDEIGSEFDRAVHGEQDGDERHDDHNDRAGGLDRREGRLAGGFGVVAVLAGLILVVLLLFFILAYYVRPIYKMLASLRDYRSYGKKYTYNFEGDDQLSELNAGISDLAGENQQLRKRLTALRNSTLEKDER